MRSWTLRITLVVWSLVAGGCAAIGDVIDHQRVYGGTRFTAEYLSNSDGPWKKHQGWKLIAFYPVVAPCLIVDMPFTLALDTVFLPYTLTRAARVH